MTPDDPVFINSEQIVNTNHLNLWFTLEISLPTKCLIFNHHQRLHGLSNSKLYKKKQKKQKKNQESNMQSLIFLKNFPQNSLMRVYLLKHFFTAEFFAFSFTPRIKTINPLHK